ncbi:MAG TPA: hypothetical protein VKT51_10170 [Candidatus Eremiobacteraceae bacterium]|nr:hypothetical protein [Candidatus Eremiobacteraceae bacterium]
MSDAAMALPLARRIIVDGLLASTEDADALVYRVTPRGFFLAPREPGRVHDYRYDDDAETFHVFDQFGDPVGVVALDDDEWVAVLRGFNRVPFHFGGAQLLLAALSAK